MFHVKVDDRISYGFWLASFVYIDPSEDVCTRMWSHISTLVIGIVEPWMIYRDFNVVAADWEKAGGRGINQKRASEYNVFLSNCGLMEMNFKGQRFTWSNRQF